MELPVDHLKHAIARGTNGFGHPVQPVAVNLPWRRRDLGFTVIALQRESGIGLNLYL